MADKSKHTFLERVFAATSIEESRKLYDEWAKTYNSDMADHEFTAPQLVAQAVPRGLKLNHLPGQEEALGRLTIADAGCGTGLVGIELARLGVKKMDGLDISQGMLDVAKQTGAYRSVTVADLTAGLPIDDGTYDAVTCCGTFTHGHLGPEPLQEFLRIVKTSGIVVATVLETHWEERGFGKEVQRLAKEEYAELLESGVHAYRKGAGVGRILILRKKSSVAGAR